MLKFQNNGKEIIKNKVMTKYIDKDALVTEIEKLQDSIKATAINGRISKEQAEAYKVCVKLRSFVEDTLEVKEIEPTKVPKHSYFETTYHCGTEPTWKIGDVLAIYEFYSDREGEYVYGEVIDVKMDEDYSDWVYTVKGDFGGYEDICENLLLREQAYKKNK